MPSDIPFIFGLSPKEPALSEDDALWSAYLPLTSEAIHTGALPDKNRHSVTYGDYFAAARDFLAKDDYRLLLDAAEASLSTGRLISPADVSQVGVYLLKHGAFYHPALIKLSVLDKHIWLVLNVALSQEGQSVLPREYEILRRFHDFYGQPFWPQVFGCGQGHTHGQRHLPMFLGEWLTGFYEFHLTGQAPSNQPEVVVWDTDNGNRLLKGRAVLEVLCSAARILTYAYNPLTFEAILDWHHAAGDFVVNPTSGQTDVRMITVRNYGPLVDNPEPDVEQVLDGLLLFLVAISLRLRLDRLDGTGATAVYPNAVVPAICQGFWRGLGMSLDLRGIPDDFISAAKQYFLLHRKEQLGPLVEAVLAGYPPSSDDGRTLRDIADNHTAVLAGALSALQAA